ncbi:hypothetical protein NBE98_08605 [Clostridium swellfunianum]|uniref:hypothetical protein n=1 Tax=Clostridium swellfunianum TaxID=1367462 RepID=UPI00202E147E|nr:hypothetical protein [Clostridium swellfunianum]MCM0648433.1 hypothetical protein [Clostridium swellfunianum]
MQSVKSKICREKLYKRIYEPCETNKSEKVSEESNAKFYNEAAKLLAQIYLAEKGGAYNA